MSPTRRPWVLVAALALSAPLAVLPASASDGDGPSPASGESPQVVLAWERAAMRTVYPATPIPSGVPLLGFTSVAMYDAVRTSLCLTGSSETAAAARAARDVLVHYFPASAPSLDAQLAASLAPVTDPDERSRGERVGAAAAADLLASRAGDGYGDPEVHYTLPPAVGTWQPVPPATDMLAPWLGSLEPLVLRRTVHVDGPDPLTSRRYARDYEEVRRLGGSADSGTERTQAQTDTALFFNDNSAVMVADAVVRRLEAGDEDLSLLETSRLFAEMHAAMTDSVIQAWRLKREVGFWRPVEAVAGAGLDDNAGTAPQAGWAPLLSTPRYSEYVSGHASLTGPAVEVVRRTLGERTPLELVSVLSPTPRTYETLRDLEHDAFMARIWGGLHFRDAMADGYRIAHRTARRVMAELD